MTKKEEYPARLVRACQEDTSILTSLLGYFEVERQKRLERLSHETDQTKFYRLQGEAHLLGELRVSIANMVKAKEEAA